MRMGSMWQQSGGYCSYVAVAAGKALATIPAEDHADFKDAACEAICAKFNNARAMDNFTVAVEGAEPAEPMSAEERAAEIAKLAGKADVTSFTPSKAFWKAWKADKSAVKALGITVTKEDDKWVATVSA